MEDTSTMMSLHQKQNTLDISMFQSICFVLTIIQLVLECVLTRVHTVIMLYCLDYLFYCSNSFIILM